MEKITKRAMFEAIKEFAIDDVKFALRDRFLQVRRCYRR